MGLGEGCGRGWGMGYGRASGGGMGRGRGRGRGQGKGAFSGYTCVKFLFFAFNVIFWLLGCAILGVGIWMHITKGSYASLAPSFGFLSATALCISAGAIVLVVGFFGCCGAIMENQCMLLTYFLLVVVIFMLETVAGILAFIHRTELERVAKDELSVGIKTKYPPEGSVDEAGLRHVWDEIQSGLKCCGVNNYTDWYKINAWPEKRKVPDSCCLPINGIRTQRCGESERPNTWHKQGCLGELKYWFRQNLFIIGVVGITIGVIQILGLVAAMALFCCLRADKYEED